MDRITFLRSMLGNAALLTLPPLELLPAAEQDRLAWTEDAHSVFIFDAYVRGFQHYAGPRVLRRMKDLDVLDLVREYDNQHDPNAVAVYWEGNKVGYLPMGENVSLANMMDHGLLLECHVVYTRPDARHWEQCFIAVQLLLPANPSFNAYMDHYMDRPDAGYKRRPEYGGEAEPTEEPWTRADTRVLKQAAALQHLGELRFMRFIAYLLAGGEWQPYVVQATADDVEHKGLAFLQQRMNMGRLLLHVSTLGADHYWISLHQRGAEVANGGEWEVEFDAAQEVVRAEQKGFSIS